MKKTHSKIFVGFALIALTFPSESYALFSRTKTSTATHADGSVHTTTVKKGLLGGTTTTTAVKGADGSVGNFTAKSSLLGKTKVTGSQTDSSGTLQTYKGTASSSGTIKGTWNNTATGTTTNIKLKPIEGTNNAYNAKVTKTDAKGNSSIRNSTAILSSAGPSTTGSGSKTANGKNDKPDYSGQGPSKKTAAATSGGSTPKDKVKGGVGANIAASGGSGSPANSKNNSATTATNGVGANIAASGGSGSPANPKNNSATAAANGVGANIAASTGGSSVSPYSAANNAANYIGPNIMPSGTNNPVAPQNGAVSAYNPNNYTGPNIMPTDGSAVAAPAATTSP